MRVVGGLAGNLELGLWGLGGEKQGNLETRVECIRCIGGPSRSSDYSCTMCEWWVARNGWVGGVFYGVRRGTFETASERKKRYVGLALSMQEIY